MSKKSVAEDNNFAVQLLELVSFKESDAAWLPSQVRDKLKSNVSEYLQLRIVVDSEYEYKLKKLQAESEKYARDEKTQIQAGNIKSANYVFYSKITKIGTGYILNVDCIETSTGIQTANVSSKEYTQMEYLYGNTGAVDEITLKLADKFGIEIPKISRNLLTSGSSSFSVAEQIELINQNEINNRKILKDYESNITKLSSSKDIVETYKIRQLEAAKALLQERQKADRARRLELEEQLRQAELDAKKDANRSIELKAQRDSLSKISSEKAAEIRKLKFENQSIWNVIRTIEEKKSVLIGIRDDVKKRCEEIRKKNESLENDEISKIENEKYLPIELNNGKPTEDAKNARIKRKDEIHEKYREKSRTEEQYVIDAVKPTDDSLLSEIEYDQEMLKKTKTASSLGSELKVRFADYNGDKHGWNTILSFYSNGICLFNSKFIFSYELLIGKKPLMETAEQKKEYNNSYEMYHSLLLRGDSIVYFELDYSVIAEAYEKPSRYEFKFDEIRAINIVEGKTVQSEKIDEKLVRTFYPIYDIEKK